ncbi:DNA-binding winged helix-turn-helix (wHTH) protein [Bradyrhizobium sp. GM7.3]
MIELSAGQGPRGRDAAAIPDFDAVAFGPFSLRSRLLEKDGLPVRLGSRAMDILRLLVSRAGEVVPKNEILGYAWSGLSVEEVSLRVHVAELRKVLGDGKDGARYITNIPGRGYCFVAPVRRGGRAEVATPASRVPERAAPPPSLPRRLDRMVGREDAVAELAARLLRDRFVTLRGPGGIGKTTVATALAHEMCDGFDGNVHFLEFGPLKDGALVASTVAAALGLVVHHEDPSASIVNFLRGRRLLLVLDSCEHVIEEVARLAENIYREAPGIVILATSRESLLVEGEQIFELVSLPGPPQGTRLSAGEVLAYPAVRLFVDRAVAAGHRDDITDEDAEVLARICGKLDGIALAIELAAARVGLYGLREMAALLDNRLQLEWRGRRTAPPRQQTLGATLDWSFRSDRRERADRISAPRRLRRSLHVEGRDSSRGRGGDGGGSRRRGPGATRGEVASFHPAGRRIAALSPARRNACLCPAETGRRRTAGADRASSCSLCSMHARSGHEGQGGQRSCVTFAGKREPARRCPRCAAMGLCQRRRRRLARAARRQLHKAVRRTQFAERGPHLVPIAHSQCWTRPTGAAHGSSSFSRRSVTP